MIYYDAIYITGTQNFAHQNLLYPPKCSKRALYLHAAFPSMALPDKISSVAGSYMSSHGHICKSVILVGRQKPCHLNS